MEGLPRTYFGLVGRKLGHSWSPAIHAKLSEVPYVLREVEPDGLEALVREETGWLGLNVTIPYKRDVMRLADEVSSAAERIGAANTLVRRADGSIYADNTDVSGFAYLLDRFCERELGRPAHEALCGRKALVLGSGGASAAVVCALEDAGAVPVVISRRGPEDYASVRARHADASLVVNATPVGMYPNCPATPLDADTLRALPRLLGVVDVVYNPTRTGICLAAEEAGIPSESGLAMLVAQAVRSSELFQGRELDLGAIGSIEQDILRQTLGICLIGMPGVGKTTTGKRLARMLGRPFVDMDDAFTIATGMTPSDCIRSQGEGAFRRLETEQLRRYSKEPGLVMACGGGVVTREENRPLVRQNSYVVMLSRDISQLSQRNRPISQAKGLERLARERMPLYRAWADVEVDCLGSAFADAEQIARLFTQGPALS
jgi:shikimate dehydrogenase